MEEPNWNVQSLKEHLTDKISSNKELSESEDRRLNDAIKAGENAVKLLAEVNKIAQDKFEASVRGEFVKVNEFRGALEDLGKNMATRRELETAIGNITTTTCDLAKQISDLRSRVDVGPTGLQTLQSRIDTTTGVKQGAEENWAKIVGIIAVTGVIIGIIVRFI